VGEANTEIPRHGFELRVVGDHERNVAGELPPAVTEHQIVQAVIVAGDEDGDPLGLLRVEQPVLHLEALTHLGDGARKRAAIAHQPGKIETNALEEHPRDRVRVLVGIQDVRAMAVEDLRERRHDTPPIGARDEQRGELGGVAHLPVGTLPPRQARRGAGARVNPRRVRSAPFRSRR
jgi:hypothetical protein